MILSPINSDDRFFRKEGLVMIAGRSLTYTALLDLDVVYVVMKGERSGRGKICKLRWRRVIVKWHGERAKQVVTSGRLWHTGFYMSLTCLFQSLLSLAGEGLVSQ